MNIISYTHQEGVLHRDIKPGNIIRRHNDQRLFLIDFDGAIKRQLEPGIPVEQSLAMGTRGYAPLEQLTGRDIDTSADLYAIAATCVHLITGMSPENILQISGSSQLSKRWRQYAPDIDNNLFANILDRMLLNEPAHRYRSAEEIIDILSPTRPQTPPPPPLTPTKPSPRNQKRKSNRIKFAVWFALPVLAIIFLPLIINYYFFRSCLKHSCTTNDGLSWGEEILTTKKPSDQQEQAVKAFRNGDYKSAIENLQTHLQKNPNDPEALIYLNNAIAALTENPVKIATSVPIDLNLNIDTKLSKETLRGIAQAQSKYNCGIDKILDAIKKADTTLNCGDGIDKPLLQVQIADESVKKGLDNTARVKEVANNLLIKDKDKSILAVVGHSTSKDAAAAAKIYGDKLVSISPDSTVVRDKLNLEDNSYLFRTSSTDRTAASDLIHYISRQDPQKNDWKVAVIGDYTDYSNAFRGVFEQILKQKGIGKITGRCELTKYLRCSDPNNPNIKDFIKTQEGADIILLALDFDTSKIAATEVLRTLSTSKIKMLGIDGVYNQELLKALDNGKIKLQKQQLVVAVPWHRSKENEDKSQFEKDADNLWGGPINWRTAMAYDATQAIVNGLIHLNTIKENITSENLYKALKGGHKPKYGAAGTLIDFCDGDRKLEKGIGVLVEVVQNPKGQNSKFSLLYKPERDSGCKR